MGPSLSIPNTADCRLGNSQPLAHFQHGFRRGENIKHLRRSQFGVAVAATDGTVLSGLRNLVDHIVEVGSEEEMDWVNAPSIVAAVQGAGAVITDSIGDRSVCNFPRNSMRENVSLPEPKSPIAIPYYFSAPLPTLVWAAAIDLAPEARDRARIVFSHDDLPGRCGQERGSGFTPRRAPNSTHGGIYGG